MKYTACFPAPSIQKGFQKVLEDILPKDLQEAMMKAVEALEENPRPFGRKFFKTISPPVEFYEHVAHYRIRIGDYRILYDVNDERKIVWILALRKRNEKTYRS